LRYGCDAWVRLKPDTTGARVALNAGHDRCVGPATCGSG